MPATSDKRHPSRRTQAQRRAETEQRVLDATMRLIAAHGVGAVTLAAVGTAAGYSRGIVSHHFGSRQGLLDALVERLQDRFEPPDIDQRGLPRLLALIDAYLDDLGRRSLDARVFLVLWAEALASEPALRRVFAERDEHFRRAIAHTLHQGINDASIRADVKPDALAVSLVGLLRGTGLQSLVLTQPLDLKATREQVRETLRLGLTASLKTKPRRR